MECEDGRWLELAQDRVQWRAFVIAVLKFLFLPVEWSRGVSIGITTVCGLDGQGSILGRGEISLSGCGAHPSSYPTGTGALFPGFKRQGREADCLTPSSADVNGVAIPALPHICSWRGA
jgi:hypothetical protein